MKMQIFVKIRFCFPMRVSGILAGKEYFALLNIAKKRKKSFNVTKNMGVGT
jgi:hypothetical protein